VPGSLVLEHKGEPHGSSEVFELGNGNSDQWTLKFVTSVTSSPITIFINVTAVNSWTVDSSGVYRPEYTQSVLFTGSVSSDSSGRIKPRTLEKSYGIFPLDWLLYLSDYDIQMLRLHRAVFAFMVTMLAEGGDAATKKLTVTLEGGGRSDIDSISTGEIYFKINKEIKTEKKVFTEQFLSALSDEKDSAVIKLLSNSIEENAILLMLARIFLSPSDSDPVVHYQLIESLGVNLLRLHHNAKVAIARCDAASTWRQFMDILNRRRSIGNSFVSDVVENILDRNSTISVNVESLLGAYRAI